MGLLIRLIFWFTIVAALGAYKFLELVVRATWVTVVFLTEIPSQGFSKAEFQYWGRLQVAIQRPLRDVHVSLQSQPLFFFGPIVIVGVILSIWAFFAISSSITQQRQDQTRAKIEQVADDLLTQVEVENQDQPLAGGKLSEQDGWHSPLIWQRKDRLTGVTITVISAGPDGLIGTGDDLTTSRFHGAEFREIGGELVDRGKAAIKNRFKKLLGGDEKENEDPDQNPQ
ncbi:hypothetical protein GC197_05705 [bacterium]|nr:hypothetical protein [bacterium]